MPSAPSYLLLFSLPFLTAAQSLSPASPPSPAALPDPIAILTKHGNFSIFLGLLSMTGLVEPLLSEVNSSNGISLFAPTDSAFKKVSATLAKLSNNNKRTMVMYHGLLQYVSVGELVNIGNPVETFAEGLTLDFIEGNVSTGVVTTKVGTPLYDDSPLGIFPVEDVLIPPPQSAVSLWRAGLAAVVGAVLAYIWFF